MKRAGPGCFVPFLAALLLSCGGGSNGAPPPGIAAVLIGFASGEAPPGVGGAVVEVVDAATGEPLAGATVVLNGVTLAWSPASGDYQGAAPLTAGGPVSLAVTTGGGTCRASATFFTVPPTISLSSPAWAARCEGRLAWSDGQPAANGPTYVAFLDAADPGGDPGLMLAAGPGTGELTIGAGSLSPGERLVFVGTSLVSSVPGAAEGSFLALVNGQIAPLRVADADYRAIEVGPAGRGIATGGELSLAASGPLCNGYGSVDLTARAAWSTSDAAVVAVGNAPGAAGVASGVGPGTATVTADVDGIRGATAVRVRDITEHASPGDFRAVAWSGSAVVAAGEYAVASSNDLATWTVQPVPQRLGDVAASAGRAVAIDPNSTTVHASGDLLHWAEVVVAPAQGRLQAVAWTGTEFVAVGEYGTIVTSPDGVSWTERSSGLYALSGVTAGGPRIVAVGGAGAFEPKVLTSLDGHTWAGQDVALPVGYLTGVAWSGSLYVAVGSTGAMTSPDGLAWTQLEGLPWFVSVAASPHEVMAFRPWDGEFYTSTDGQTWTAWTVGYALTDAAWTGDRWVMVGPGTVRTSP